MIQAPYESEANPVEGFLFPRSFGRQKTTRASPKRRSCSMVSVCRGRGSAPWLRFFAEFSPAQKNKRLIRHAGRAGNGRKHHSHPPIQDLSHNPFRIRFIFYSLARGIIPAAFGRCPASCRSVPGRDPAIRAPSGCRARFRKHPARSCRRP